MNEYRKICDFHFVQFDKLWKQIDLPCSDLTKREYFVVVFVDVDVVVVLIT
jgi:hypothetical protein